MWAGTQLEPYVAALYSLETGVELQKVADLRWHPLESWMGTSLDYLPTRSDPVIVECKTTSRGDGWGQPWTDEVPEYYLVQVMWQLAVTRLQEAHLACLGPTPHEFRIFRIPRSDAVIDRLVEICGDFWMRLRSGWMPEPDWADERTWELIPLLYAPNPAETCILDESALGLVQEREALTEVIGQASRRKDEIKARLIERMGHAVCGYLPDGRRVERKSVLMPEHIVKAHKQDRLTVRQPKKAKV